MKNEEASKTDPETSFIFQSLQDLHPGDVEIEFSILFDELQVI